MRKVIKSITYKLVLCGSIAMFLNLIACTLPVNRVETKSNYEIVKKENPVKVMTMEGAINVQDDLEKVPLDKIRLEFYKGVTIHDFVFALSRGLPKIGIVLDVLDDKQKISIPRFDGTLRDLLRMIQNAYGYSYRVKDQTIIISDNTQVIIKLPSAVLGAEKRIKDILSIFMVVPDDVSYDQERGVIIANMNFQQYRNVCDYLQKNDLCVYMIEIGIVETSAEDKETVGMDIEKLFGTIGQAVDLSIIKFASSGNVISVAGQTGKISLSGVLAYYQKFNNLRLSQMVKLGVASGSMAKVDLSRKVPYISRITAVSGNTGSAVQGYEFDTAQDGLVLEVHPVGDYQRASLATNISYSQVVDYMQVGTGENQISRPVVQLRSYNSDYSIVPGEVVLIGSLRVTDTKYLRTGMYKIPLYIDSSEKRTDVTVLVGMSVVRYRLI